MYNRCTDPLTVVKERRERVAQDILREHLTPEVAEQMVALADGTQWEADGGVWLKRVRRPGGDPGDVDADPGGSAHGGVAAGRCSAEGPSTQPVACDYCGFQDPVAECKRKAFWAPQRGVS